MATGNTVYLDEALGVLNNDYYAPPTYVHCWNDVWTGAMCLISECNDKDNTILDRFRTISGKNEYEIKDFWSQIEKQIQNCMSGSLGKLSPQGYFSLTNGVRHAIIQRLSLRRWFMINTIMTENRLNTVIGQEVRWNTFWVIMTPERLM